MATVRSPSPNPSRAKTPDSNNFLRKSTTSSFPSKPSISIDPQLRSSCPKDPFDHSKENKPTARARSPAIHTSRASKNFMAPTISAASKVTAPSPRKKILQERNEVSSSISDSLEEAGVKSNAGLASPEIFSSNSKIKNHSSVVPSFSSPSPAAGADPSVPPPYDPKTNYLSPRPQFLHYRPNPRIENRVVGTEGDFLEVGDGKRLEDSFSSESDEDGGTVATEEKDSEEEECSLPSVPSEVEEEEGLGETHVAVEPEPESKPFKPLLSKRSKLVPILLVMAIAFVFVPLSDSPIISSSSSVPNDQSFGLFEYHELASVKLHDLASRFKHWSSDSIAYLISVASSYSGEVGSVSLVNITSLAEDEAIGSDFIYKHETRTKQGVEDELEDLEVVSKGSAEDGAEKKEMEVSEEIIETEDTKHEAKSEAIEMEYEVVNEENEAEKKEMEVSEEVIETEDMEQEAESEAIEMESEAVNEDAKFQKEDVLEDNSAMENAEYEAEKVDMELPKEVNAVELTAKKFGIEFPENGATNIEEPATENHQDLSHILPATSSRAIVGLLSSALLLLLVAGTAFLYTKQKRTSKKVAVGSTYTPTKGKGSPLQHLRNEDLTDFDHSVASSGLDNTFSYGQNQQTKRGGEGGDNLSHERRLRRDSTASSSVSSSYGSFTTYERLSAKKKGSKDEEVATPVRRSSRLRSTHATSS